MGVVLAGVLLQDCIRFVWFSAGTPSAALINDSLWLALSLASYLWLVASGRESVPYFILAWGVTGTVCFMVGAMQLRLMPSVVPGPRWLREQRELGLRFAGEVAIDGLLFELGLVLIGSIAGLAQLGVVFAGRLVMAPVNVLFMGLSAFAIPEGVRLRQTSLRRMNHLMEICAAASVLAATAWTGIVLAMPGSLGEALFGDSWSGARSLLIPTAIGVAAFGVTQAARAGLRALADARRSFRARAVGAPGFVVFGTIGATVGQGLGAAWGLAVAFLGLAVLMSASYRVSLTEASAAEEGSPGSTPR